jgi:hypothetical protein
VKQISLTVNDGPHTRGDGQGDKNGAGHDFQLVPLFPRLGTGKKNLSKKTEHTAIP